MIVLCPNFQRKNTDNSAIFCKTYHCTGTWKYLKHLQKSLDMFGFVKILAPTGKKSPKKMAKNVSWGVFYFWLEMWKITRQSCFDTSSIVLETHTCTQKIKNLKKEQTFKIKCYYLLSFHEFWQFSVPTDNFPVVITNKKTHHWYNTISKAIRYNITVNTMS